MAPTPSEREWDLPMLKATNRVHEYGERDFYSVKFYPYTSSEEDPIFAVVGGEVVIVFRISSCGKPETVKLLELSVNVGDEREEDLYSCVWTRDPSTRTPLLCAAGHRGVVYIIDVVKGEILRVVLTGHGGDINDLAISPSSPYILASASYDQTVRIWSLDPAHEKYPLAAMLLGEGHKADVYTIAFHHNGRHLLSGGADSVVNLWTLPIFPDKNTGTAKPTLIRYPHFSSSEIHDGRIIDCVAWHGDLILSKSEEEEVKEKENVIVLWCITSFDSSLPPPSPSQAPAIQGHATKSYFSTDPKEVKFVRLAHFHIEDGDLLYTRFGLSPVVEGMGPVLGFMTKYSRLKLWDLRRLVDYVEYCGSLDGDDHQHAANRPAFLHTCNKSRSAGAAALARVRDTLSTSSTSISGNSESTNTEGGLGGSTANVDWKKSANKWREMYRVGIPGLNGGLKPHKEVGIEGKSRFTGRMVSWSAEGGWCVAVGSKGFVAVFGR
ncbi:hypothetical protein HYALB_00005585 [Hymenoscyphus albidus]|uniref:WD40 repeat-like protein n=1 Tax=Hymenoscyphus albidus TaxID=595503 RepID=A0A9N9LIM1_9HELO|nr:hypothetical protein HYALB_00005585 [Hymenoscyphus albidus]